MTTAKPAFPAGGALSVSRRTGLLFTIRRVIDEIAGLLTAQHSEVLSGDPRPTDSAGSSRAAWEIVGARHAGITVSDLDRSLEFYCGLLGMDLLWRRLYAEAEIRKIVGVADATAFNIAMLQVPGSDLNIELIDYKGCERHSGSTRPCDYGTGHFCVFVRDIESLYTDLRSRGVVFRSDGPVEMTRGASRGGKSLYSVDPDGYIIEFHEPPHQLASA